jgi:hypothetical protein
VTCTQTLLRYQSTNYDSFVEITPNDHGTQPLQDLRQIWDPDVMYRRDEPTNTSPTPARKEDGESSSTRTIPTPLQAHTIPLLTMGYDVLVNVTGSQATVRTNTNMMYSNKYIPRQIPIDLMLFTRTNCL